MAVVVRPADLEADRALLIDTLLQCLTPRSDAARFDWLYRNGPHGQARVWIASDSADDAVVGLAGAFPRRLYAGEHEITGWVLGDFCIHERYRSLGPALQLQRACLAEVDTGRMALCYDFPSASMLAIYQRLRLQPAARLVRLARPLRMDRRVGRVVRSRRLARGVSAVGNLVLRLRDTRLAGAGAVAVALHQGGCSEEFSALARALGGRGGVCVQRSAEYLNWRYLANPLYRYEFLTARRAGALLAYAVFTQTEADATLADLHGVEEPGVVRRLVASLVALLRQRGVHTLSVPILESHPWLGLLRRLGFSSREASPMVVYTSPALPDAPAGGDGSAWWFMHGDRDS